MIRIVLFAAISVHGGWASACPAAERVGLGMLATTLDHEGERVEVCGMLFGHGEYSGERFLLREPDQWGYEVGVYIFDPESALGEDRQSVCVVGVQRRRDGLTGKEAQALGRGTNTMTDMMVRYPDYVFYPEPCQPDAPARG
jgi:hypothetical protein